MGCGGGRAMINDVISARRMKMGVAFNYELRKKFLLVLQSNPFYQIQLDEFKTVSSKMSKSTIEDYVATMDFDDLTKKIFTEVYNESISRFSPILPEKIITRLIIHSIMLFLTKPKSEDISIARQTLIEEFISSAKSDDLYHSGRLSYVIVQLILFITNILIYFLLSLTILQVFENMNKYEMQLLLIEKQKVSNIKFENIFDYFSSKLEIINPRLKSPHIILDVCLPYVCEPIKECNS